MQKTFGKCEQKRWKFKIYPNPEHFYIQLGYRQKIRIKAPDVFMSKLSFETTL